jgi:hypothetical protein
MFWQARLGIGVSGNVAAAGGTFRQIARDSAGAFYSLL